MLLADIYVHDSYVDFSVSATTLWLAAILGVVSVAAVVGLIVYLARKK